ncbi:hypothetical protein PR048_005399 [Dryococelus australis]|uniref:Peptidase aspartic putative domain-containing protein n=1 Tax=Dryococelus australis TaxID=614101 RepID=A0ABQ9I859_9NEOP|nr:hypothetical protein PR048_005399 [Dryococelus australis]
MPTDKVELQRALGFVSILLGADVFFDIIHPGKVIRSEDHLILQDIEFGWIVSGRFQEPETTQVVVQQSRNAFYVTIDDSLDHLKKFWEIEELHETPKTLEEMECERHFTETFTRE